MTPRAIDLLARSGAAITVVEGTSHATAGTASTHEIHIQDHVGRRVTPTAVIPVANSEAASIAVTAFDADEVTIEASESEVEFTLIII